MQTADLRLAPPTLTRNRACRYAGAARLPAREAATAFGPTLVIAPHPDDETLGCGGAVALLRSRGVPVWVLVLSDGAASHPNSRKFPRRRLTRVRLTESLTALDGLGVLPPSVFFFNLPDGDLPLPGDSRFGPTLERCAAVLERTRPRTVLAPWRRDPHADHRAAWQLAAAAVRGRGARLLEYPVWLWDLAAQADRPRRGEARALRLDITPVLSLKRRAISAYRSQLTGLISDDPTGFRMSTETRAHFEQPWEVYFDAGAAA